MQKKVVTIGMLKQLSDELLWTTYDSAIKMKLSHDFIELIEDEIRKRNIPKPEANNTKVK